MVLTELEINNFRLFPHLKIRFSDGINIISGLNGQGKTSILESIYYLALTKSFRTSSDTQVIYDDKKNFDVIGNFSSSSAQNKQIRLFCSESEGKHLFINKKEVLKFSEYIGTVPCVVLTLDDLKLTLGGPNERRKFLNILISQVSPVYLADLKIYRRTLQQRNALLGDENKKKVINQIQIWNEKLIEHGTRIIKHRMDFIEFLNRHLAKYYSEISGIKSKIDVIYQPHIGELKAKTGESEIAAKFEKRLLRSFEYEYERRATIVGPHRDDIHFLKTGKVFRDYCSQGENKTLVIALKFLEWEYISKECDLKPILLLDDIFGELDEFRMQGLLSFLEKIGQAYITTTMQEKFKEHITSRKYLLRNKKLYDA